MEISGRGRAAELAKLLLGVQEVGPAAGRPRSKSQQQGDRVQISDQAKELRRITSLTKEADPVRAERLERLQRAIDNGTYSIDGRSIGDALIRHALTESVL
ncbi:MAG TPA: flagellar biosynthesis anti-sigma factor FlgM [Nitrospira sp.]|nr:flagellar biosynthesis anti-sigma factor FlgM [Nitrospira sp.]